MLNPTDMKLKQTNPHLPWNQDTADQLGPTVMHFVRDQEAYFRRWMRKFYENYHFLFGNQKIQWSRRHDFAVDTDFLHRQGPSIHSHSQTNIVRLVVEALSSMIYGQIPDWDAEALDQGSVEGKRYADIVESMLDAYMHSLCMDKEFSNASVVFALFGQVGAKISWDRSGGTKVKVPIFNQVMGDKYTTSMAQNPATLGLIEKATQLVDARGNPIQEQSWQPQQGEGGEQTFKEIQAGDTCIDILTPFEYRREPGSHGLHKSKWVQHIRLMDYDDFLLEYTNMPGRTDKFREVFPTFKNADIYRMALQHFFRMKYVVSPLIQDDSRYHMHFDTKAFSSKILVIEHYDKPHPRKWPDGRRVVVANGLCTHINTPDYNTGKKDGWHPFAEAQWLSAVPSSMASGPINDVVIKNRELNTADSLIATALRRNMGSQLLIQNSSGLDPQKLSGTPGGIHETNDINGARWLHDDMPLPPVITAIRDMQKNDTYESTGVGDALRGDRSVGVSSGYHAKQIEEREQKRLSLARRSFDSFVGTIGEKLWSCTTSNAITLGQDVVGYLSRNSSGKFSISDVMSIVTQRIQVGTDVKVVKGSMAIKSVATQQATILELIKGPFAQLLNDPGVMDQVLKLFDAEELRPVSGMHRDAAQRENEVFSDMLQMGPNTQSMKPVVCLEDDDKIHHHEHTKWFLENREQILQNPWLLQTFILHMETHRLQEQTKLAEQMPGTQLLTPQMMDMASGQPGPDLQQVHQYNLNKLQNPQAPSQPKAEPGGPNNRQTDPNAPSQNTPQGSDAQQGGAPS